MAGERDESNFDEGELPESTIATEAPAFDLAAMGVRSPISEPPTLLASAPPPPVTPAPAAATPARAPLATPRTASAGFMPVEAKGPAAVPTVGRAKAPSSPLVPTPLGGIVPQTAPAPAPAAPAARVGTGTGRVRAQTVVGLAPPPPGAPRPQIRPVAAKAAAPAADANQGAFGLDASVAEAARAAALTPGTRGTGGHRPANAAPAPAATPVAAPVAAAADSDAPLPSLESSRPKPAEEEDGTATRAVPREYLPPPGSGAQRVLPNLGGFDKDEETQARVPGTLHVQDARVVQDDAGGEDATVSVGPGMNQALKHLHGAFGSPLGADPQSYPQQQQQAYSQRGAQPMPNSGHPMGPTTPPLAGWNEVQSPWNSPASTTGQIRPMVPSYPEAMPPSQNAPYPGYHPAQGRPPQQGGPPPQQGGPPPQQGWYGQGQVQGRAPMPTQQTLSSATFAEQMGEGQFALPGLTPRGTRVVIALLGVVCVSVFVAGVVLFMISRS
jgi:hypothetical protein